MERVMEKHSPSVMETAYVAVTPTSQSSTHSQEEMRTAKELNFEESASLSTSSQELCVIQLEKQVFDCWREIAKTEGSCTDSQTAYLLLQWYGKRSKKSWDAQCLCCQAPLSLSLLCTKCQMSAQQPVAMGRELAKPGPQQLFFKDRGSAESTHQPKTASVGLPAATFLLSTPASQLQTPFLNSGSGDNSITVDGQSEMATGDSGDGSSVSHVGIPEIHSQCKTEQPPFSDGGLAGTVGNHNNDVHVMSPSGDESDTELPLPLQFDNVAHTSGKSCQGSKVKAPDILKVEKKEEGTVFACKHCNEIFVSQQALSAHSVVEHSTDKCSLLKVSKYKMQSDTTGHSLDKAHVCELCEKSFRSASAFQAHIVKIHSGGKPYQCDLCDAAFGKKTALNIHKRTHNTAQSFTCSQCGLSCKSFRQLSSHCRQAHDGSFPLGARKPFRCEVCHVEFMFKRSLTAHMKSHNSVYKGSDQQDGIGANSCVTVHGDKSEGQESKEESDNQTFCEWPGCTQSFPTKKLLHQHMMQHTKENPLSCNLCGKRFRSEKGLSAHTERQHIQQAKLERHHTCDKCQAVFRFKTQLTKHKQIHKEERPYACGQCGSRFKTRAWLRLHECWHEDLNSAVCHLCGKSCLGMKSLGRHIRVHHGSDHMQGNQPYKCTECTASFSSLGKLTSHRGVHAQQNPLVCDHCGQAFRSQHTLTIHVRRHTGEKPFQCSECQEAFIDKCGLKRHQRKHASQSAELCHVCGAGFPSKEQLAMHIQRHTEERPFKCSQCAKAFKTSSDLKSHMMSHCDDRPFQCSHCSYAARTKDMLNRHLRKHTGERPFRCEQCSASFTYNSCLAAHRKLHTNTKPFVCEVCSAAFFTAYNLLLHSRKHSGERPYKCHLCPESFSWHSGLKCHMKKHQSSAVQSAT